MIDHQDQPKNGKPAATAAVGCELCWEELLVGCDGVPVSDGLCQWIVLLTSRMTPSPTNLPAPTCNLITPCNADSAASTTIETASFAPVCDDEKNNGSCGTADDTEPPTPFESDDEVVVTLHGLLLPLERPVVMAVPNDEAEDPKVAAGAATLLQAHIRACLQRHRYKLLVLEHKLRAIEAT